MKFEYQNTRRVIFSFNDVDACFLPVCFKCGRYIKIDKIMKRGQMTGNIKKPNATCSKCGRIQIQMECVI